MPLSSEMRIAIAQKKVFIVGAKFCVWEWIRQATRTLSPLMTTCLWQTFNWMPGTQALPKETLGTPCMQLQKLRHKLDPASDSMEKERPILPHRPSRSHILVHQQMMMATTALNVGRPIVQWDVKHKWLQDKQPEASVPSCWKCNQTKETKKKKQKKPKPRKQIHVHACQQHDFFLVLRLKGVVKEPQSKKTTVRFTTLNAMCCFCC